MNKLGKIILLFFIIIIIITALIMLLLKKQGNKNLLSNEEDNYKERISIANKLTKINDNQDYFIVKQCLDSYKMISNDWNYSKNSNNERKIEKSKDEINDIIPDFVKEKIGNNIYDEVIFPDKSIRIDDIYKSAQAIAKKAYEEDSNVYAYVVKGKLLDTKDSNKNKNFKIIAIIDMVNNTYYIIPEIYINSQNIEISENNSLNLYMQESSIPQKNYNNLRNITTAEKDICQEYMDKLKLNLRYDSEYVYEMLDENYKNKRFENYDIFKKYIINNIEELKKIKMVSYTVGYYEGYTEYVCKDQYDNLYIFNEKMPLEYNLKFDTYTLTTDKFKEIYEKSSSEEKAKMNIDKFVQMINRQDYKTSYSYINQDFRNNNFGTQNQFEEYINNEFYKYNKIKFLEIEKIGSDIFVMHMKLTNIENEEESKKINIIIQINENLDFEIAFQK